MYEGDYYRQEMDTLLLQYEYNVKKAIYKYEKRDKGSITFMESKIEEYKDNIQDKTMLVKEAKIWISSAKSKRASYKKLFAQCHKHHLKILLANYKISVLEFKKEYYVMKYEQVLTNESYENPYKLITTFNDKEKKYFIKKYNEFKNVVIPDVDDLVYKKIGFKNLVD